MGDRDSEQPLQSINDIVIETAEFCTQNQIGDPVKIPRILQKKLVTGKRLEIQDETESATGETNFIVVDRKDIVQSALDEIGSIDNLRLCLEVQFYGEVRVYLCASWCVCT